MNPYKSADIVTEVQRVLFGDDRRVLGLEQMENSFQNISLRRCPMSIQNSKNGRINMAPNGPKVILSLRPN
jgi:hypothetical protein